MKPDVDGERHGQLQVPSAAEAGLGTAHSAFTDHRLPQGFDLFRVVAYFLAPLIFISFTGFHRASLIVTNSTTSQRWQGAGIYS